MNMTYEQVAKNLKARCFKKKDDGYVFNCFGRELWICIEKIEATKNIPGGIKLSVAVDLLINAREKSPADMIEYQRRMVNFLFRRTVALSITEHFPRLSVGNDIDSEENPGIYLECSNPDRKSLGEFIEVIELYVTRTMAYSNSSVTEPGNPEHVYLKVLQALKDQVIFAKISN